MSEKFSVQAILSARDKDFTSGMRGASAALESFKSSVVGGLGFGILSGIGQKAFEVITNSATGLIDEMNTAKATWDTFTANMEIGGKGAKQIAKTKSELQEFAEKTIYSSSEMASTFAQLDAVGTKSTLKLVKGFGGLAAAAENPKQAMKTLSQQATQMAAKPKVAWQDFKLMLEQTPAGIAAVAKEMGMTTGELVKNVQDGKVATEDFFDAIAKVGTNKAFTDLAEQYKTVDQAMDGLQETVSNKLSPAFDVLSEAGIGAVSEIIDAVGKLNAQDIASKLSAGLTTAGKYWNVFKEDMLEVGGAFGDAFSAISTSLGELNGAFGSAESINSFADALDVVTYGLVAFAGVLEDHSGLVAAVIDKLPMLFAGYMAFKAVKAVAPGVSLFGGAVLKLASKGVGGIAAKLFGVATGEKAAGSAGKTSSKQMLTAAKSFALMGVAVLTISAGFALLAYSAVSVANAGPAAIAVLFGLVGAVAAFGAGMTVMLNSIKPSAAKLNAISVAMLAMGAAVLMVSAGFAILSASAINLANAGPLAIGVMVGMVAAIALLAVGAATLAPALTAGAVGFIAFGAGLTLVGVGAMIASAALSVVAGVLPTISQYGLSGAEAIIVLSTSMVVFAAGAALAGVGATLLGAGLIVAGTCALVAATGILALGAAVLVLSSGILVAASGIALIAVALPLVGTSATSASAGLMVVSASALTLSASLVTSTAGLTAFGAAALVSTVGVTAFGTAMLVSAAGTLVMAASLTSVNSSMKSISRNAKSAERSLSAMQSSVDVVQSGLDGLGNIAKSAMKSMTSAFDNGANQAKSSGKQIGDNLQNGVKTGTNKLPMIAKQSMAQFNSAINSGGSKAVATARTTSSSIITAFRAASGGSYSAGVYIGQGLANGMRSQIGPVRAVAAQLAAAADAAIRAKAKINSPAKVTIDDGEYMGEGLAVGMENKVRRVRRAAEELTAIPKLPTLRRVYAGGFSGELPEEYDYYRNTQYTIIVPVEMDGREVARVTAPYTEEELNKRQTREKRKRGIL